LTQKKIGCRKLQRVGGGGSPMLVAE